MSFLPSGVNLFTSLEKHLAFFVLILELATRLGPLTTALIENPRNSEGLFLRLVIFDFSGLISKSNRSFSQSLTAINIRSASDLVLHMILRSSAYLIM